MSSWTLKELLNDWAHVQATDANTMISGLSLDSRLTQAGDLFFAIQGLRTHGIEFCKQAIANGAVAIAWDPDEKIKLADMSDDVPCVPIPDLNNNIGFIAQRFYHHPSEKINVIAVTGTDGKTSVSQFIAQAFNYLNVSCGVIGTLGYGIYPDKQIASHTTPDAIHIQSLLKKFNHVNAPYTVIEASSHGLKQKRLNGVMLDTAVFTNLGRDHLDYHETIEDYFQSKRMLFQMPNLRNAVINIDDELGCRLANELVEKVNLVTYACGKHQSKLGSYIQARKICSYGGKITFEIDSSWGNAVIENKLYGNFNVSNIMAALAVLLVNDYKFETAIQAISSISTVPGRMEPLASPGAVPTVIIDFAHTPQALKKVLQVLREQSEGKLWCVFGCGGDRDPGKRKLMANAVEKFADYAVVTDDNPRTENPDVITQNIIAGFSSSANYTLIHDRKDAIAYAVNNAACEDTVLIAGKGHETVQILKDRSVPFDDKKIAQIYLNNYR